MKRIKMFLTEEEAVELRQKRAERNREAAERRVKEKPKCVYTYSSGWGKCLQNAKIDGYCGTHYNKLNHPEKLGRRKQSSPECV